MSNGFLGGAVVKNLSANGGGTKDLGSIPGLGRCPWRREGRLTPVPLLFGLAFQLQRSRPPLCKAAVHGLVTAVASVVAELSL